MFINGDRKIHNVGQKEPNKYNLYDIIGNVWEWCWDIYGPYESGLQENPVGLQSGEKMVSKGGSYTTENTLVRDSDRGNGKPVLKGKDLGVRVVRSSL
ncbi:MAG: SUMF1/EgtB/PvdO family nonheme iron enzyme [Ignavibacteriales bacterium]|nr:SUMF1/EgtB/PvdO family nonheme iron enzyme [Ignavibacteriales bacterium]